MNFTIILVLSMLVGFLELLAIYSVSTKTFEIKIINNELIAIKYSTYLLLPFTTKIRRYKNIKEAYIRKRKKMDRYGIYNVYDLMLQLSKRSTVIVKEKRTDKDLLRYCEKINKAIKFFKEYTLYIHKGGKGKIAVIFLFFIIPLVLFLGYSGGKNFNFAQDIEFQYFVYVYLITSAIIIFFMLLSLTINRLIITKNNEKVISSLTYSAEQQLKEKSNDMSSDANKIYDSIIKK